MKLIKNSQPLKPADHSPSLSTEWISNEYIHAATSDNTRRAYRSDIKHFEHSGGKLPATPEIVVCYLHQFANQLNPRTLSRRLAALKAWHIYQGFNDPTQHALVQKTMTGIIRTHASPKVKAPALTPQALYALVANLKVTPDLSAIRDNAILQVGYFGAFRRSELVSITLESLTWHDTGLEILLSHSKTDQLHEGQICVLPKGNDKLCPMRALQQWIDASKIMNGPIFRAINKKGSIATQPLTPLVINHIIKRRAHEAKLENAEQFSSHSLRRGLATSAAKAGASLQAIMRSGRWKQTNTVMEYIELADRFNENAAKDVLNLID